MWFYDEVFQLIQEKGKLNCRRVAQRKKKQSTVASTEVAMVPCKAPTRTKQYYVCRKYLTFPLHCTIRNFAQAFTVATETREPQCQSLSLSLNPIIYFIQTKRKMKVRWAGRWPVGQCERERFEETKASHSAGKASLLYFAFFMLHAIISRSRRCEAGE
jgi:hypothetical protein